MKITALHQWAPPPGVALRWQPTASCRAAAAAAPVTTGPLTFLAENHIRGSHREHSAGAPHRAYLGSATELDGELDVAAMTQALEAFVRRHEILRSWFDFDGDTIRCHVVAPEDVAFEVVGAGQISCAEELNTHLRQRFESETCSDSFPGLAFGVLARPEGFSMFLGCDHALSDGASQALALPELAALYDAARTHAGSAERDARAGDGAPGFFDYAAREKEIAERLDGDAPEVSQWRETFARNDLRMPRFPLDLGLAPGETAPVRPFELELLEGDQVTAFDTACKSAGGNLLSGVFAALALTGFELGCGPEYYGMTVLNTRGADERFSRAQGWFCAFAPIEVSVRGAASFTDVVPGARVAQQRAKSLGTVPVQHALGAMVAAGATADSVVTAPNLVSYIDFRWFPGNGSAAYDRGVIFTGEGRTANASVWINRDHDRLYLGSQTPDTPFAQRQIQRYFEHLRTLITDVASNGDRPAVSPENAADESHGIVHIVTDHREPPLARHHH
ncbi:condensation domain-containing protein [Gordonia sp. CPCC 206044]|uniref:condensation domain-containing protein n=1 Tax=Gordonia sp. CPCC 206044 TaxID=3140793 RepID=UPI003AF39B96